MVYSEARSNIKSGDIIAVSHYKWASLYDIQVQAVRIFTESEYSHVGMVMEWGDRLFVIESVTPYVRIVPLSVIAKDGFYHIPLSTPITDEELTFAMSKVGVGKYSKWEAIKAQLGKLKIGSDNLFECAEFVLQCRALSGMNLGNKATPSAVVKELQSQGFPVYFIT